MALRLNIIVGSTRPGRQGIKVADWFHGVAVDHGKFEPVVIDIADFNLPVFDEPRHPRLRQYEHAHTRAWSEAIEAADAFVFVTPEYNHFAPPALVNALAFLSQEWQYKPVAMVSYAGLSGGYRAQEAAIPLFTALRMMPIPEGVGIALFTQHMGENGAFNPPEQTTKASKAMLDELLRWAEALKPMRAG